MRQRRRAERQLSGRSASAQVANRRLSERQRQRLLRIAIVVVLVGLAAMLAAGWYFNSYQPPRKVVAEIDGVQYQLREALPYALLDAWVTGSFVPEQGLNNMVGDGIIERRSAEIGADIDPAEVGEEIVRVFEPGLDPEADPPDDLSAEGRELFDEFLGSVGVDEDEYRTWIEGQLRRQSALEYFSAEAPETTEQIHVEWIVTQNVTTAREAMSRLEDGEEFADVAADLNEDVLFSDRETGVLGWVPEGVLQSDVDAVLFAEGIEQGEVQGTHTTAIGTIVFRITDGPSDEPLTGVMRELWAQNDFQAWIDEQTVALQYYFTQDDARWLVDRLEDL